MRNPNGSAEGEIESILCQWRQGDCTLGDNFNFYFVAVSDAPNDQAPSDEELSELVGESVLGLVLISQTCDIVRSPGRKPYVDT